MSLTVKINMALREQICQKLEAEELIHVYSHYHGLLVVQIQKRLLLRCIHHFESDLINNMDNMCISGTEPSSVNLSQRK